MDELPLTQPPAPRSNVPELSVSELAFSLQRTLENAYGRVRVRGEISGLKIPGSGHLYADLKDAESCLSIICWRSTLQRLKLRPEDGMDVVCTGKITTYPKSSRYQLIVDSIELAGQGALLKMLEDRKTKLAAEGLFAAEKKRALPFLPETIGVITSPTGAVIRDILHRLEDRFPRHVLVWPVLVQGAGAAEQVAAAINGFNAIPPNSVPPAEGSIPRPDLLIVARGGGSLEDLMAFNEEVVVRAAAASGIPLISAVGHETDTTLIDFASDRRAPTPTAAAEMAVPVRRDLIAQLLDDARRLYAIMGRILTVQDHRLDALRARLGDPNHVLEVKTQTLDHLTHRLDTVFRRNLANRDASLREAGARLSDPGWIVDAKRQKVVHAAQRLAHAGDRTIQADRARVQQAMAGLRHPRQIVAENTRTAAIWSRRLADLHPRLLQTSEQRLARAAALLEAYSFKKTLQRGFALVRDDAGIPIKAAADLDPGAKIEIEFYDGRRKGRLDA